MLEKKILITDIGSTTTKTLLFEQDDSRYIMKGMINCPTTVEKPDEDVKIGILASIRKLEKQTGVSLLAADAEAGRIKLNDHISFLATSSAGGGLQILVIGLTLFDSASSAERAAYGAGGVLLDTIAIDDKRSSLEQMQLMEFLHPDIILFSGGIDGGAISSVVKLAEILAISDPKPKFSIKNRIPLIYAGNVEARDFIETVLDRNFELHMLPNVRPTMTREETEPVSDKIHEIFLNNVMEQAPGYLEVKRITTSPIIPTPSGVLHDMQLLQEHTGKNILAVDIGGATTDIFSALLGKCHRTVSANYGLSYSISNVMKNCGLESITRWLPDHYTQEKVRNYIYNKMLFPAYLPQNDGELAIEQAVAIEAIRMSKAQHLRMHFNIENIGFLDKLKNRDIDPFVEQMYAEKSLEHRTFHLGTIDILIGAGGVISHAPTIEQAIAMMVFGFQPEGVTELWRDKDFISPHLGVLSEADPGLAYELLMKDCYEKLAIHIRPYMKQGSKRKKVLTISSKNALKPLRKDIVTGIFEIIPNDSETEFEIEIHEGYYLDGTKKKIMIKTALPLLVDTRDKKTQESWNYLQTLGQYSITNDDIITARIKAEHSGNLPSIPSVQQLVSSLPYTGEVMVHTGQKVNPSVQLGQNTYGPPRIYVTQLLSLLGDSFTPEFFLSGLKVKAGDTVEIGQIIFKASTEGFFKGHIYRYESNIRARVTGINPDSASIIMREIQDYSTKPYTIDIASSMGIPPRYMKAYIRKQLGDFVNVGETLAMDLKKGIAIKATHTGTIINIDWNAGTMTIQYLHEPHILQSHINGYVKEIRQDREFVLEYEGISVNGMIGFGKDESGELIWSDTTGVTQILTDKILVYPGSPTATQLEVFSKLGICGLIIPSIEGSVLSGYLCEEIGVALTGNERIPFPIMIMAGFGNLSFTPEMETFLKKHSGKHGYIKPKTQIRAGVIRPQLIIS